MAKRRKTRYAITTEIGMRLPMSNETLEFIEKHDPDLYKLIMDE